MIVFTNKVELSTQLFLQNCQSSVNFGAKFKILKFIKFTMAKKTLQFLNDNETFFKRVFNEQQKLFADIDMSKYLQYLKITSTFL